jgi:hypothetical protein
LTHTAKQAKSPGSTTKDIETRGNLLTGHPPAFSRAAVVRVVRENLVPVIPSRVETVVARKPAGKSKVRRVEFEKPLDQGRRQRVPFISVLLGKLLRVLGSYNSVA